MREPSATVLSLEEVHFRYHRGGPYQLRGVTLSLRQGDRCVVMGPNGGGKTTLLRLCAGLVRPEHGRVRQGRNGSAEILDGPVADIAYIPQHLGLVRSRTALANAMMGGLGRARGWRRRLGVLDPAARDHATTWLANMGLGHKTHERVDRLSGGERQRVAIARSLVQRPRILVADEFVSSLDLLRQRDVLEILREQALNQGTTLLVALHNFEAARQFATRFLFLQHGGVAADLPADQVDLEVAERFLAA